MQLFLINFIFSLLFHTFPFVDILIYQRIFIYSKNLFNWKKKKKGGKKNTSITSRFINDERHRHFIHSKHVKHPQYTKH